MGKSEHTLSTNDEVCTPAAIYDRVVEILGPIGFDPCSHPSSTVPAQTQVLLPRGMARIWYWINEVDGRSLWYPTARLLPQTLEHDGWRGPVSQAIEGLQGV